MLHCYTAKFIDHLIVLHGPVYPTNFLLLQTIKIEISLHCCDEVANCGTNTHKPVLYLMSFGRFFQIAY